MTAQQPSSKRCTPNVLPCRIHHNGPFAVSKRYWSRKTEGDGYETAYFRGRKLRGRKVKLPKGYEGTFARSVEKTTSSTTSNDPHLPSDPDVDLDEEEPAEPETAKVLEGDIMFDHVVVWGHEAVPAADDPFVKGVEEWIAFAEAINSYPGSEDDKAKI